MTIDVRGMTVTRLSGTLGARIEGLDLTEALDDETMGRLRELYDRYHLLVFSGQDVRPEHQVAFARRWGAISVHPGLTPIDGHPEVVEVYDPSNAIASTWHQDQTFLSSPPALSTLVARVLPEAGGDTLFANQHAAFERLSPTLRGVVEGLRAVHRRTVKEPNGNIIRFDAEATHPMAPHHPRTGRRALFVNSVYTVAIEGMTLAESAPLLEYLYEQATRPEISCRHHWTPGDVVLWDNRSLLHCVVNDATGDRLLHKVTVAGDPPV